MSNTERKIMPPLWIWGVLFVVIFSVITFYYRAGVIKKEKEFASRTTYLRNKLKSAGSREVILFIGSSPTQCALEDSYKFEACLKTHIPKPRAVLKLWREETSLETMIEAMPILQEIKPAVLIVEANMMLYASEENLFIQETQKAIYFLLKFKFRNPFTVADYDPDGKPQIKQNDYRAIVKRGKVADTSRLTSFRKFANHLQQKGTKIILLNIPLEASEEKKKWSSPDTVFFNRNFKFIREEVAYKYFDPKFSWGMDHYIDRGHMNEKGRNAFSAWLCKKLVREL